MYLWQVIEYLADRWWRVLLLWLLNTVSFALLFNLEDRFHRLTGEPVFDTQNDLTSATLIEQLGLYVGQARQAYVVFSLVDFLVPLLGATVIAVSLVWLLRHSPSPLATRVLSRKLPLVVLTPAIFDWMENMSLLMIVGYGLTVPQGLVAVAIVFKRLKLTTLGIAFLLLILTVAWVVLTRLHQLQRIRG